MLQIGYTPIISTTESVKIHINQYANALKLDYNNAIKYDP